MFVKYVDWHWISTNALICLKTRKNVPTLTFKNQVITKTIKSVIQGQYDKIIRSINLFLLVRYWMFIDNVLMVDMLIEGLFIIIISYFACYWTISECLLKLRGVFPSLLLVTACIWHVIESILNVYWRFIDSLLHVYGISLPQYWMFNGATSITQVRMKGGNGPYSFI